MGGKSSSSSSSSSTTIQTDKRVAATDSARVTTIEGSSNTLTDHDAIAKAGELALQTLTALTEISMTALSQNQSVVDNIGKNSDSLLEFVDNQRQDEDQRTLKEMMPFLIAGVSVLALTGAFKK